MRAGQLDLIHFQWAVYRESYRWMQHGEITAPTLTAEEAKVAGPALIVPAVAKTLPPHRPWRHADKRLPHRTPEARYYSLIPGMFKTFAHLEPSTESILKFVGEYGHLGLQKCVGVLSTGYWDRVLWGEYFADWQFEVHSMKQALAAWEMARSNLVRELSRHVLRGNGKVVRYDPLPDVPLRERPKWGLRAAMPTPAEVSPDLGEILKRATDRQIALLYVQHAIDVPLKQHCSLSLIADIPYSQLSLHAVPQSLAGALWLQFAVAISGDSDFRKCKMCTTWFEVGPGARRSQSLLCSDACKTRSTRERIRRARQLKKEGKSDPAIAKQLQTTVKRVQGWTQLQSRPF